VKNNAPARLGRAVIVTPGDSTRNKQMSACMGRGVGIEILQHNPGEI